MISAYWIQILTHFYLNEQNLSESKANEQNKYIKIASITNIGMFF